MPWSFEYAYTSASLSAVSYEMHRYSAGKLSTCLSISEQATKNRQDFALAVIRGKSLHTLKSTPIAEILQPVAHICGGPGGQQLEQATYDHTHLQLVGDDDAGVMPAC
jgi:hypothetical protein